MPSLEFADSSGQGNVLTANGSAVISSTASKFGGGSCYFPSTGSPYVSTPDGALWNFGTKNFTIDCWVNFESTGNRGIISQIVDDNNRWQLILATGNTIQFYAVNGGSAVADYSASWTPTLNQWYHIAVERDGISIRLFIDGTEITLTETQAIGGASMPDVSANLTIGLARYSAALQYMQGWIDSVRITIDKALWTSNFLVPASDAVGLDDETVLLIHGNRPNDILHMHMDSSGFPDDSSFNHSITNTGCTYSTGTKKFGLGSVQINTNTDQLTFTPGNEANFGTGDFTIELWYNYQNPDNSVDLVGQNTSTIFLGFVRDNQDLWVALNNNNYYFDYSSIGMTIGNWYHIAAVRKNGILKVYLNGQQMGSSVISSESISAGGLVWGIGKSRSWAAFGYYDEVRISNVARYNGNFNVPTSAFPDEIVDASPSLHQITSNSVGISSAQTKLHDTSIYFNGSAYLSAANSSDWDFGGGDFTVECWFKLVNLNNFENFISWWSSGNEGWMLYKYGSAAVPANGLTFQYSTDGSTDIQLEVAGVSWDTNWHHLAATRNGSSLRIFLDGNQVGSTFNVGTDTIYSSTNALAVGAVSDASGYLTGYMDEVRITKGLARWTADFVPPVRPYPNTPFPQVVDADTKLLLHGNALTTDYSPSNHTISNTNVALNSGTIKFHSNSLYFDGTAYLSIPTSDDWTFGADNFTIEFWYNSTYSAGGQVPLLIGTNAGYTGMVCSIEISGTGTVRFLAADGVSALLVDMSSSSDTTDGLWHHAAVVRRGSTFYLFIDGVVAATDSYAGALINPAGKTVTVGDNGGAFFRGYMDEFRITKNVARYISQFDPQQIYFPDAQDQSTKLLLHFEQDNIGGSTYFKDSSYQGHDLFPSGTVSLSSANQKFGSHSLLLSGATTYIETGVIPELQLGTSSFTIDFWYNTTYASGGQALAWFGTANGYTTTIIGVEMGSTGYIRFLVSNGVSALLVDLVDSGHSTNDGAWHHAAFVRSGSNYYLFVDGVQRTSGSNASALPYPTNSVIKIGSDGAGSGFNGYIDEFRFTKGVARWTSAFTSPTAPYSDYM